MLQYPWVLRYRPDCEQDRWEVVMPTPYPGGEYMHYIAVFAEYKDARAVVNTHNRRWAEQHGETAQLVLDEEELKDQGRLQWGKEAE